MNRFLIALAATLLMYSCATANITPDMSAAELIQRGQEAMDKNRYGVAIQYYEALHERYKTNIDLVITAEYHIGFIHYKQGKLDQARSELTAVLEHYNSPDEELYPQHFKKLSIIVLNSIQEKENSHALFKRKFNR